MPPEVELNFHFGPEVSKRITKEYGDDYNIHPDHPLGDKPGDTADPQISVCVRFRESA